jgi:3-oxoadipate enol-lactonase
LPEARVPFATLPESPLAPGLGSAAIHYRERGLGPAVVLLHGGWGYEAYPFDAQAGALAGSHRVLAPDRTGYGRSGRLRELPDGFHRLMAEETVRLLDALGIERAALWGHSDGAVIAAWAAILFPDRVAAVLLEALHFWKAKPRSLDFFRTGAESPERFGDEVVRALARDHGEADWRGVVGMGARAWLRVIADGMRDGADLFDDRLGEIGSPVLVLHGTRDPRTEPGEIEAAARALPVARVHLLEAGHAPHTSATSGEVCTRLAVEFLREAHAR